MAHFAIVAPEAAGHIFGLGALGHELHRRGHRVTLVSRSEAAPLARRMDLPLYELSDAAALPRQPFGPLRLIAGLFGARVAFARQSRFCSRAELVLRGLPSALEELAVDALLVDRTVTAAGTVAEHMGLPFATVFTGVMWNEEVGVPPHFVGWPFAEGSWPRLRNRLAYAAFHTYMRPVLRIINRYRHSWNLTPFRQIADVFSPTVQISQMCPELDFPRHALPGHFHYVGSMVDSRPGQDCPFPWDRLDERPLIYASLGTVGSRDSSTVFPKIASACAGLDAQLVIALGKWGDGPAALKGPFDSLAGDPIVVNFAPQVALLERAALLITHAGANTVLESLSRGVPMVALPRTADHPAMAARLEHAGVGLRASFHRFTPEQLRRLAERVLTEESFRLRAQQLQQALAAAGGVQHAAELAEEMVAANGPVRIRKEGGMVRDQSKGRTPAQQRETL